MIGEDQGVIDASARPTVLPGTGQVALVLASASQARAMLLAKAGVPFHADPANIDEAEVKLSLKGEGATAMQAAETLAELKARHVSRRHAGALVLGADQILERAGTWFDKPADRDEAAAHLRALAGKRHTLETAVCIVQDGTRIWHHNTRALLRMRPFGEAFLADYLELMGEASLLSVGAYAIEGPGLQLFEQIEGDYFTVLGLPLLPLLGFLRTHGVIAA